MFCFGPVLGGVPYFQLESELDGKQSEGHNSDIEIFPA